MPRLFRDGRAALALGAFCALFAPLPAAAGMFLGDLLPSTILVEAKEIIEAEEKTSSPFLSFEGAAVRAAARNASVTTLPEGGVLVGIEAVTMTPMLPTAPKISASGLRVKLSGVPIYGADDLCAWIDRIEAVTIDGLKIERSGAAEAGRSIIDAFDLRFTAAGGGGCVLGGVAAAGSVTANLAGGQVHKIADLRSQFSVPASAAAAETRREASSIKASIGTAEFSKGNEIPSFGLAGASLTVNAETATLSGLLQVLRATNPFVETRDPTFLAMQIANAATMMKTEAGINLPVIRAYAAGVVPSRSVANFGRVGLSTISGAARAALTLRGGDILGEVSVAARGVGELTSAFDIALYPYSKEKLVIAAAGQDLGFHLLPDLELRSGHVTFKDAGLDRAFEGITGAPMGRYLEEVAGDMVSRGGTGAEPLAMILGQAGQVARRIAAGERMRFSVNPQGSVPILDIILGVLRDPAALARDIAATVESLPDE